MEQKPYAIGNHVRWCREGDTLTSTNPASRTEAPVPADTGWIDLGLVDITSLNKETTTRDVKAAQPGGQKVLYDKIPKEKMISFGFTLEEIGPVVMEYLFDTDAALNESSTTYAILGSKNDKGWLEIKQYDQDDVLFNTVLVYVYAQIDGSTDFGDEPKPAFTCDVLYSTLNEGTLADNS